MRPACFGPCRSLRSRGLPGRARSGPLGDRRPDPFRSPPSLPAPFPPRPVRPATVETARGGATRHDVTCVGRDRIYDVGSGIGPAHSALFEYFTSSHAIPSGNQTTRSCPRSPSRCEPHRASMAWSLPDRGTRAGPVRSVSSAPTSSHALSLAVAGRVTLSVVLIPKLVEATRTGRLSRNCVTCSIATLTR